MKIKICTQCKLEKSLLDYHVAKLGKYGRAAVCKDCTKINSRSYVEKNKEKNKQLKVNMHVKKKCFKCKKLKFLKYFDRDFSRADGFRYVCKECSKIYSVEYVSNPKNKEKKQKAIKAYKDSHRIEIRKKAKEYDRAHKKEAKEYYEKNKTAFKKRKHLYYLENREETLLYQKLWTKENRKKSNLIKKRWKLRNKDYLKNYAKRDYVRIGNALRGRIRAALKCQSIKKDKFTKDLTGCSISFLMKHLNSLFQPGMSWDNYSYYGWHIDHIKPCASFNLADSEEQKKCFHYSNLQPLWAEDNLRKSDKILNL